MVDMSTKFAIDASARATLFTGARSNLVFADTPVDMAAVRDVWDLVKFGPTALNTVPLRLVAATSPDARARVISHAAEGNRRKLEGAPLILVAAGDTRFHDAWETTGGSASSFARFDANEASRAAMAHTNAMLQTGYLILGLRAAGLAVRPMGGFDRPAMDADLLAGTTWRSELLLAVGYPADDHGAGERQGRIDADEAIREL